MTHDPSIPPEPELPYRLYFVDREHHATALGYVCMTYAMLELTINHLIEKLVPCSVDARRSIVDALGSPIEKRCVLINKLASLSAISDEWKHAIEHNLSIVMNDISKDRNRLVHDVWFGPTETKPAHQLDERALFKKKQSHQTKQIAPRSLIPRELNIVWSLVRKIQEANVAISDLSLSFDHWRQTGTMPIIPPNLLTQNKDPLQDDKARPQGGA